MYGAAPPETPIAPLVVKEGVMARVMWEAPESSGMEINGYEVGILQSDGVSIGVTRYCDGTYGDVVNSRYCDIPMLELRSAPYNYMLGDSVTAYVRAKNDIGWSSYSLPGTSGSIITMEPS